MKVIVLLLKDALEGHDYGKTYDRKKENGICGGDALQFQWLFM